MDLKRTFSFAGIALLVSGSASAADLPPHNAPSVAPFFSWAGSYIGGNVGGGWSRGNTDVLPGPDPVTFRDLLPQTLSTDSKGVIGGGQFGYNWQTGNWVWGFETDFQGSDVKGSAFESPIIRNDGTPFPGSGSNISIHQKVDWFGTVRARLGATIIDPRFLLYGTGGFAYGHVSDSANTDFRPVGTEQYPASVGTTRGGWVVGAGGEWAFATNWTARVEYLHVDLGAAGVTALPVPADPPFTVTYDFKTVFDVARFGINYKF